MNLTLFVFGFIAGGAVLTVFWSVMDLYVRPTLAKIEQADAALPQLVEAHNALFKRVEKLEKEKGQ